MNIFTTEIDKEQFVIATYELVTNRDLAWATSQIAYGQSTSSPNVRCKYETDGLFENHSCRVLHDKKDLVNRRSGTVKIAFPLNNIDLKEDCISQLLCFLLGGHFDINGIERCRLTKLDFPSCVSNYFKGPKYGISGIRSFTKVNDKPLLLGILKPKIVISPKILVDMTIELIDGGCNLIKEDECMSNQSCLPFKDRVKLIAPIIKDRGVVFYHCINSDYPYVIDRAKYVVDHGGNGVHINFWNGLSIYKTIRDLDLPLFMHFQRSGSKILTDPINKYSVSWIVLCQLSAMMGVDTIHSGMIGGYGNDDEEEVLESVKLLNRYNVLPSLSCGFTPGLVQHVNRKVGVDYAVGAGGSLHAHPEGSLAGAKAMTQAINKTGGHEYDVAIKTWGLVE